MKKSEIITANYQQVAAAMIEQYRHVIACDGQIQVAVYIWSDGEIETLEQVAGDTSYLVPRQMEPRELFHVATVAAPCFNPWDYTDHAAPDDEQARDAERDEIIDWLTDEYQQNVNDALDAIICDAERLDS